MSAWQAAELLAKQPHLAHQTLDTPAMRANLKVGAGGFTGGGHCYHCWRRLRLRCSLIHLHAGMQLWICKAGARLPRPVPSLQALRGIGLTDRQVGEVFLRQPRLIFQRLGTSAMRNAQQVQRAGRPGVGCLWGSLRGHGSHGTHRPCAPDWLHRPLVPTGLPGLLTTDSTSARASTHPTAPYQHPPTDRPPFLQALREAGLSETQIAEIGNPTRILQC